MIDETHQNIQALADWAGWSNDTLLNLIARWADEVGEAEDLLAYLDQIASAEDEASALD